MEIYQIILLILASLIVLFAIYFLVFIIINKPHVLKHKINDTRKYQVKLISNDNEIPYLIKVDEKGNMVDEPFKVISTSDTHISSDHCYGTLKVLERFINIEKPDLVILNGDNIVGVTNYHYHKILKKFFEDHNIYFGFTLGNHDSEAYILNNIKEASKDKTLTDDQKKKFWKDGRRWAYEGLCDSPYCVNKELVKEIGGAGNCVVNLVNNNGVIQSIFLLDSGDYAYGVVHKGIQTEQRCYDYIKDDKLNWYKETLKEITLKNNNVTPKSIVFFHIPLIEHRLAIKAIKAHKKIAKLEFGHNYEGVCCSDIASNAFKVFKECNSTTTVIVGHDHKNDSSIIYDGIRLMYGKTLPFGGTYNRHKRVYFMYKLMDKLNGDYSYFNEGITIYYFNELGKLQISETLAKNINAYEGLDKKFLDTVYFKHYKKKKRVKTTW